MHQRRGVHAAAGVGDAQADEISDVSLGMHLDVTFFNAHGLDADGERTAARHGVAGVDGKIHDDLLNHAAVADDDRQFGGRMKFQRDVLADEALEHFAHVADGLAQIERPGLHHVFAAEHEQLAREAGCAFGGEINGLNRVADFFRH